MRSLSGWELEYRALGRPQATPSWPMCDFEQVISLYEPCLFLCKSRLSLAVLVYDMVGKWL